MECMITVFPKLGSVAGLLTSTLWVPLRGFSPFTADAQAGTCGHGRNGKASGFRAVRCRCKFKSCCPRNDCGVRDHAIKVGKPR